MRAAGGIGTCLRSATAASLLAAGLLSCAPPLAAAASAPPLAADREPAQAANTLQPSAKKAAHIPPLDYSLTPSEAEPYAVCPPKAGVLECMAIAVPTAAARSRAAAESPLSRSLEPVLAPSFEGTGVEGGFSPSDLRGAYDIPESGGSEQIVAIVDAYKDPNAESDLNVYRHEYGLPECTASNKCFKQVNQEGTEGSYPENEPHWSVETSIDVDMVSAVCPDCKILLVEATNEKNNAEGVPNLYIAENEAASWEEATTHRKATEISDSWGRAEFSTETSYDKYFEHADVAITAAGGDYGYGVNYPAASPQVISVGGTSLAKAAKTEGNPRGWEESVWNDSGGGRSAVEANRIDNDVAAVANPYTPVSIYDSYPYAGREGWLLYGGTSVATPIIAAVEAHASAAVRDEGREAFYRHSLFDVTSGSNGQCSGTTWLCHGTWGYDSPTGWGSPDGPLESQVGFQAVTGPAEAVTVESAELTGYVDPGGSEATFYFEYGPTTAYGTRLPAVGEKTGSGETWKSVSESTDTLQTGASYHYRLVASDSSRTIDGADHTFTPVQWADRELPLPSANHKSSTYGESALRDVSCASATDCVAVGRYMNLELDGWWPLEQSWNGREWQLGAAVKPSEGTAELSGVSCSSTGACMAVGTSDRLSYPQAPLAEHLTGTKWEEQTAAVPPGASDVELLGVSCESPSRCTAVGEFLSSADVQEPLVETWTEAEGWSVASTPKPPEGAVSAVLERISCASGACVAVGRYETKGSVEATAHMLVERWSESEGSGKWLIQSPAIPPGAFEDSLEDISCSAASACTAVGEYESSASVVVPLAERWSEGKWTIQSMPFPTGRERGWLLGVSCPSSGECVAVGGYPALAMRWNGVEWLLQGTSKNLPAGPTGEASGAEAGVLLGVSCVSSSSCSAVGTHQKGNEFEVHIQLAESYATPASAKTEAASGVGKTAATLHGTLNPEGLATGYYFEYGTTTTYGARTPETSAGAGTGNIEVSASLTGLKSGAAYHFRLVAAHSNSFGGLEATSVGEDRTFGAPIVDTGSTSSLSAVGATLKGTVDPDGWEAKYFFEYGTTTAYGEKTPLAGAGSGMSATEASKAVIGLLPETTYHFRVVAESSEGSAGGEDVAFKTAALTPSFSSSFGSEGSGNGQFAHAADVAVDPKGNLWVLDQVNDRVQKFNAKGEYVSQFGSKGSGNGQFETPDALAIDAKGDIWVTDTWNHRVEEFNEEGKYLKQFGSHGTGNGQFMVPEGIAVSAKGNIWVSDAAEQRLQEFNEAGEFIKTVGSEGSGAGQFGAPEGIAIGPAGNIWVADWTNNRIEQLNEAGEYQREFGSEGSGNGQVIHPDAVDVDANGDIWVLDRGNSRIEEFNENDEYVTQIGSEGSGAGQFSLSFPTGIATDSKGNLWITDPGNHRIQRWVY